MISNQRVAARTVAAPEPIPAQRHRPAGSQPVQAECIGPFPLPAELMSGLRTLARIPEGDEFGPLAVGAAAVAARLSRPGAPLRAQVIYGMHETETGTVDLDSGFRSALQHSERSASARSVDVTILISLDGRRLYVENMTDSADAPSAACWAQTFLHLLARMVNEPDRPLSSLQLTDDAERERILNELNVYRDPKIRHRTMTEPFEEQVLRTPDAVALLDEDGVELTYRQLNEQANQLAHFLQQSGTGPGSRIGICLRRGIPQLVAIYATVKAGAGYVPLDAELPDARLAHLLQECAPGHVLTDLACRKRIPDGPWQVHDVETDRATWDGCSTANPDPGTTAAGLFNILHTSGSTGRPKGVAYPTDGALAHLDWMQGRYPFGPGDTALFKTSPGFDVSIWELFWPLWHGARLVICRPDGHRDPQYLARLVASQDVSTIFLAPTATVPFLEHMATGRGGGPKWVLCGGEPVTPRIRDLFHTVLPDATLVNCYGPTEAGTVTDMPIAPDPGARVPLGRPAGHFRLTLLDEHLRPVPVGMAGEAYIGGRTGLAQAYWRAPGRTAERFVADPYGPPGSRMYRTGDLCRYDEDGVLEHLGRIDRQVKVHGMRIEPGEIESVLAAHPAVADCAVLPHSEPVRLLAFVVPAAGPGNAVLDAESVREYAASLLPEHMRPERIVPVAAIPTTVNGKIDTAALLDEVRARLIEPPADVLEAALITLYSRLLGSVPVSALDNFGQLGGHSMLAFQLLDACQHELGAKPDVSALLTGTVRDVAASIRTARAGAEAAGDSGAREVG